MTESNAHTMTQTPQKFQFADLDLERELEEAEARRRFNEEDLALAEAAAEARGHAAGHAEAMASIEAATARLIPDILAAAQELADEQERQKKYIEAEAIRLARLIAARVLPVFAASQAYGEIEALIAACLADRPEEPRIVIRLPEIVLERIEARLAALVEKTGFAGKPVLLADPAFNETQARVEWANGGADWNYAAQLGEIEAAAKRLVSVKPAVIEAETDAEVFSADPVESSATEIMP